MSSTNRGYERHKTDYYVTPQGHIEAFLNEWMSDLAKGEFIDDHLGIGTHPERAKWLDPCAGGDTFHEMSYPALIARKYQPSVIGTIDVREDSRAEVKEDYLSCDVEQGKYNIIITNPPFFLAEKIIRKALRDVSEYGYVVMLLRLNFFGSNERQQLWREFMPTWGYVHHRRMSFTDDGKTDSIEYMHAVWKKDNYPEFTMLKII